MDFDNLQYSAGWFARKFPGFYNEECYYILSDFFRDHMKPDRFLEADENKNDEITSKKRKLDDLESDGVEETKDVLPTELVEELVQPVPVLERELSWVQTCSDLHDSGERESTGGQCGLTESEQVADEPTGDLRGRDVPQFQSSENERTSGNVPSECQRRGELSDR
jgi:hypothetical protein